MFKSGYVPYSARTAIVALPTPKILNISISDASILLGDEIKITWTIENSAHHYEVYRESNGIIIADHCVSYPNSNVITITDKPSSTTRYIVRAISSNGAVLASSMSAHAVQVYQLRGDVIRQQYPVAGMIAMPNSDAVFIASKPINGSVYFMELQPNQNVSCIFEQRAKAATTTLSLHDSKSVDIGNSDGTVSWLSIEKKFFSNSLNTTQKSFDTQRKLPITSLACKITGDSDYQVTIKCIADGSDTLFMEKLTSISMTSVNFVSPGSQYTKVVSSNKKDNVFYVMEKNRSHIAVINAKSINSTQIHPEMYGTISVVGAKNINHMIISSSGDHVYLTDESNNVYSINTNNKQIAKITNIDHITGNVKDISVKGNYLYLLGDKGIGLINATTNVVLDTVIPMKNSTKLAVSSDGNCVYIAGDSNIFVLKKELILAQSLNPIFSQYANSSSSSSTLTPTYARFQNSYNTQYLSTTAKSIEVSRLLQLVAEGEQHLAEEMIQQDPTLLFERGDVTDLSMRTFKNITAFQYAVWALDWHMWTMIEKYLPLDQQKAQAQQFETGAWVSSYGVSAAWLIKNLMTALNQNDWGQAVVDAQRNIPVHVVNEYCRLDRSFVPTPDFLETKLPRERKTKGGNWFNALPKGPILGQDWDTVLVKNSRWPRDEPFLNMPEQRDYGSNKSDLPAISALHDVRIMQRDKLIASLKNVHAVQKKFY